MAIIHHAYNSITIMSIVAPPSMGEGGKGSRARAVFTQLDGRDSQSVKVAFIEHVGKPKNTSLRKNPARPFRITTKTDKEATYHPAGRSRHACLWPTLVLIVLHVLVSHQLMLVLVLVRRRSCPSVSSSTALSFPT